MTKEAKQFLAGILSATTILTMSGCAKTVECNVEGKHSHTYVTEEGYEKEVESEKEKLGSFYRTDEYQELTDEEEQELKKVNKSKLLRIDDNMDELLDLESSLYDYIQYEYKYRKRRTRFVGPIIMSTTRTRTAYTNDKDHSGLTGNERTVTHKFIGYNIVQKENGKFDVVESEPMDSIEELVDAGYEYVKYGKLYASYDSETNEFIEYEDEMGPDKALGLTLTK